MGRLIVRRLLSLGGGGRGTFFLFLVFGFFEVGGRIDRLVGRLVVCFVCCGRIDGYVTTKCIPC